MKPVPNREKEAQANRFPTSIFIVYLTVLLLMSGIHTGIVVGMVESEANAVSKILLPVCYWAVVAIALTLYTRSRIKKVYESPMHILAAASKKVAEGDFSVFVPTVHTQDKYDYLDYMILDFNKMVEELGSVETLKTDFFTNVSHEIKTPLAIISSNAELLTRPGIDAEKQAECAAAILSASRRMNSLITNMLKLNKLEKQTIQPKAEHYDICEQMTECIFQLEELLDKGELELETQFDERLFIRADRELMSLVWMNLLSNAVKFTPKGGTIRIGVQQKENSLSVCVADTGCGMSEETKKHIFDKFYQGDTSHATAGNGLGLALVKRILELSGGSITVESTLGKGSEFRVSLPLAKGED